MPRPIRALIDIAALHHNFNALKRGLAMSKAPRQAPTKIWAVVKADAYGHTLDAAIAAFAQADGLAMLDFQEAARCRQAGWKKPILMLEGLFGREDLDVAVELGLTLVVHEQRQLSLLEQAQVEKPFNIYLKMNTGMHRLGFEAADYPQAYARLQSLQQVGKVGDITHMTHFAYAEREDGIDQPMGVFKEAVQGLKGHWCVSNSAATLVHSNPLSQQWVPPDTELWLRPGICLYGGSPFERRPAIEFELKSAMTLKSELISVRQVRAGEGVGYGHTYIADKPMMVGVVACGYADGYPRHAPTGTPAAVGGVRTRLVGRVSMDMLTVDLSDLSNCKVGDEVVLWGEGGPTADEVAHAAGTISYELLTAVTARVPRRLIFPR